MHKELKTKWKNIDISFLLKKNNHNFRSQFSQPENWREYYFWSSLSSSQLRCKSLSHFLHKLCLIFCSLLLSEIFYLFIGFYLLLFPLHQFIYFFLFFSYTHLGSPICWKLSKVGSNFILKIYFKKNNINKFKKLPLRFSKVVQYYWIFIIHKMSFH